MFISLLKVSNLFPNTFIFSHAILAVISVTIAMVKVKQIPSFYIWAIGLTKHKIKLIISNFFFNYLILIAP